MNDITRQMTAGVRVGDTVVRTPVTISADMESAGKRLMRGAVVYVHPRGRFHVVEFGEGRRALRESFPGVRER